MLNARHAPPRAGAMLEALRGLGYSPGAALSDILDNSLAAGASQIDLAFRWSGAASTVSILDDGRGMSPDELDQAMRLGERNPLEERDAADLGRFGLGLKTASFSQARRLTVASLRDGVLSCLRWDLDVLAAGPSDGWFLLEGSHHGSEGHLDILREAGRGTLVLWEATDRLIPSGFGERDFLDLIDGVERHLGMVFHRFLEGARPQLRLRINGRPVASWDPFLRSHPATWSSPPMVFGEGSRRVEAQSHILPHKDRLTKEEYSIAGGPDGWTAQQGFYVYRNRRLLVAGSWLGLGHGRSWTKDEPCRLARLRLDLPNTVDGDWKIDIRKSVARPPPPLRGRLSQLAEDARSRARRVFAWRGGGVQPGGREVTAQAWRVDQLKAGVRYRIDEGHPAVAAVLEQAGGLAPQLRAMLRIIEETVPVQRIWLDTAEAREPPSTGFSADPPETVREVLKVLYKNLTGRVGLSPSRAVERLLATEPFQDFPDLVRALAQPSEKEC